MENILSRKSSRQENVDLQNFRALDKKIIWLEVLQRYPGMSYFICWFQIEKLKHSKGHGCRFTMCHTSLKTALLQHKEGLVKTTLPITVHTGVFALKIISNNAILLVKLISTTFAHLGSSRVSNEAKNFKEFEFLGFSRCFSARIE